MSSCGSSLRHIFESIISENSKPSSLIESLSSPWKQIRGDKPGLDHSFTEIFGELHFKESSNNGDDKWWNNGREDSNRNVYQGSSSLNSESLQLCTEGLGSESLDYVEDPGTWLNHNKNDDDNSNNDSSNKDYDLGEKRNYRGYSAHQYRQRRPNGKTFPPPISCIGKTGKPGVSFQSYRQDGRFVLEEIMIPTYERLHASRKDGHLRLSFIHPPDQDGDDQDNGGEEQGVVEKVHNDDGEDKEVENQSKEENEAIHDIETAHS